MNYKHLSIEERSCIRKYYVEGLSYRKNSKADRAQRQHHLTGDTPKLHTYVRHPDVLPPHCSEKISAAPLVLSPRNVSVTGGNRGHKRKTKSHVVTRANLLHTVRPEDAELAHDIPLDIRKVSRERKPESAAAQGKKPRRKGNAGQV